MRNYSPPPKMPELMMNGCECSAKYDRSGQMGDNSEWELHSDSLELDQGFLNFEGSASFELRKDSPKVLKIFKFHADAKALGEVAWDQE
jgi:hypothetical protein